MKIGLLKETKNGEFRVGLTPESVAELVKNGHEVFVEQSAGIGSGLPDALYIESGATIMVSSEATIAVADILVKVKEPSLEEARQFKENQIIFCYLHLAPNPELVTELVNRKVIAIAFETITSREGAPLLCPMSIVAGRLATQVGAHLLERSSGGRGVLIGGVPGYIPPANVLVLGAGTVGTSATKVALGMGANVTVMDKNYDALYKLVIQATEAYRSYEGGQLTTYVLDSTSGLEEQLIKADLVIGSVYIPSALTTKVVSEEMVKKMKPGSVVVDVSIDQGGCFETSHPTSHANPTFVKHGVVHYCVPNMPGNVAYTSTFALNRFLLPYLLDIVNNGIDVIMETNKDICNGIHVMQGKIVNELVANAYALATK